MSESQPLSAEDQAAQVRQLRTEDPELTLDAIAAEHPELADGVTLVREEDEAGPRTRTGSGGDLMDRMPIDKL